MKSWTHYRIGDIEPLQTFLTPSASFLIHYFSMFPLSRRERLKEMEREHMKDKWVEFKITKEPALH